MDHAAFYVKPKSSPEREEFNARLREEERRATLNVLGAIVPPNRNRPRSRRSGSYEDIRPLLMEAGRLITAKEAERRVLMLENPGLQGASRITQSLYAGLQLILPGEVAPSHRHTASPCVWSSKAKVRITAVDGERATMRPGDLILTPSWTYHDHGNPGQTPVVWMDGLDIPIVNTFDASFAEHHPSETQPVTRQEGDGLTRFGENLLPLEFSTDRKSSPLFRYPYARSRETLERMRQNGALHSCHGIKMQFVNPATGGYPMPTIGASLQLLLSGLQRRSAPIHGRNGLLRDRRQRKEPGRRHIADVAPARYFRRAILETGFSRSGERSRALQLFRSAGAEGAGVLAGNWNKKEEVRSEEGKRARMLDQTAYSVTSYRFQQGVGSQPVASGSFLKVHVRTNGCVR